MDGWLRTAQVLAWAALIGVTGVFVRAEVVRPRVHRDIIIYSDIVYRRVDDRRATLDLYVPARGEAPTGGWPTVVVIHGGSWRGGTKNGYGREMSRLALHGYAVASVEYLLASPGHPSWPVCLDDVREAIRWARRHANEYYLDPDRLAVLGSSAGGHLATLLGTDPLDGDPEGRVPAVIDFYGPTDLVRLRDRPGAEIPLTIFLGGTPSEVPGRYAAASPITHASPGDAPTLIFHGDRDDSVPPEQSTAFAERLRGAGVPVELILVSGAGHSFGLSVPGRDLLPEIDRFLKKAWASGSRSTGVPAPTRQGSNS